jgi:putative acetyltransferase
MLIRRERPDDRDAVARVVTAAFRAPHFRDELPPGAVPAETPLVDALRAGAEWIPALALVAEDAGEVVGHVVCTRGWVAGRPALALGPISVQPDRQRGGVGSALMHTVLGAADALGEPLVVLLGDPAYYHRFGFRLASELGVVPPQADWAPYFQTRTLTSHHPNLRGTFRYPEPFDAV